MPKITIREVDYTRPGPGEYENFSVVVPGFVKNWAAFKENAKVDENGILEVSDPKEFKKVVGLSPKEYKKAVKPTTSSD